MASSMAVTTTSWGVLQVVVVKVRKETEGITCEPVEATPTVTVALGRLVSATKKDAPVVPGASPVFRLGLEMTRLNPGSTLQVEVPSL
jgi:hypothetical protein